MDHSAATYAVADALAQRLSSAGPAHAAPADRPQRQLLQRDRHPPQALRCRTPRSCCRQSRCPCAMACSRGATFSPDGCRTSRRWRIRLVDAAHRRRRHRKATSRRRCRTSADRRLHGAAQSPLRHSRRRGCRPGALTIQRGQIHGSAGASVDCHVRAFTQCLLDLVGRSGRHLCMDARARRPVGAGERAVSFHRSADRDGGRCGSAAAVADLSRPNSRGARRSAGSLAWSQASPSWRSAFPISALRSRASSP